MSWEDESFDILLHLIGMATQFVVVRTDYPLEVHKRGCRDIPRQEGDWIISGDTVQAAVAAETITMNSEFGDTGEGTYTAQDLFRVMPCCKRKG